MSNATFSGVVLGDHAWVEFNTEHEVEVHPIPRADGVITRRRGGGVKNITVHGWIVKNSRAEIEQYFSDLAVNLTTAKADLIVNNVTYSNCLLKSISQDGNHNRFSNFTLTFIQSSGD